MPFTKFAIPFSQCVWNVGRMSTLQAVELSARGFKLDTSESAFGELRSSMDIIEDADALRERMRQDGYLYLADYLDRDEVMEARRVITNRLWEKGILDPARDPMDAIRKPGIEMGWMPELAKDNPALEKLLYSGRMMKFYEHFLGGPVRHFDYTWFRAVCRGPQHTTAPHCDIVYMGRGTKQLYTAWTPIGDVTLEMGGLMILEGSNRKADKLRNYLERDVDTYCINGRHAHDIESGKKTWEWPGWLSPNPVSLREKLGGRWLTTEYGAGDLLTFSMATVHAALDNHTNRIRLSSDSRYQLASEPADERWIGENPARHGRAAKRGRIC
jgi:hypothetical protein